MRVADNMRLDAITQSMTVAKARQFDASQEASTGLRMQGPSGDPAGASQLVRLQSTIEATSTYRSTISSVQGDLEIAEASLSEVGTLFDRAHELAMGASSPTNDATTRAATALEVDNIRRQVMSLANKQGTSGYLFGGTKTDTAPIDATGKFVGNDLQHVVDISQSNPAVVNVSGAKAFTTAGGRDVLADLDTLATALRNNDDAGIRASLDSLSASKQQVLSAQLDAGVKITRLQQADTVHADTQLALTKAHDNLAQADPATSYSKLVAANNTMDQAVQVARTVLATLSTQRF
jgi:flagellar hook-associated protein 3 FlgL